MTSDNNLLMKSAGELFDMETLLIGNMLLHISKIALKNKEYKSCTTAITYLEIVVSQHQVVADTIQSK